MSETKAAPKAGIVWNNEEWLTVAAGWLSAKDAGAKGDAETWTAANQLLPAERRRPAPRGPIASQAPKLLAMIEEVKRRQAEAAAAEQARQAEAAAAEQARQAEAAAAEQESKEPSRPKIFWKPAELSAFGLAFALCEHENPKLTLKEIAIMAQDRLVAEGELDPARRKRGTFIYGPDYQAAIANGRSALKAQLEHEQSESYKAEQEAKRQQALMDARALLADELLASAKERDQLARELKAAREEASQAKTSSNPGLDMIKAGFMALGVSFLTEAFKSPEVQQALRDTFSIPGGVPIKQDAPPAPRHDPTAPKPVAAPGTLRKRKVLIVGLNSGLPQFIEAEFKSAFDLTFIDRHAPHTRLAQLAGQADTVLAMVGHMAHSAFAHLKGCRDLRSVNGNMSDLKRILTGMRAE